MLPPELQDGARLFNAGAWWEAHEAWEQRWHVATGDERAFLQALILLAAALHKRWVHGSSAHRNFFKAEKYLDSLPAEYAGVNLTTLRTQVWLALTQEKPPTARERPQLPLD